MTYQDRLTEIVSATANLDKLRAATGVDETLKLSAIAAGELYIQTLKRIDLSRIRTLSEMIELNEFLTELKNNYMGHIEPLKLKNLLFS